MLVRPRRGRLRPSSPAGVSLESTGSRDGGRGCDPPCRVRRPARAGERSSRQTAIASSLGAGSAAKTRPLRPDRPSRRRSMWRGSSQGAAHRRGARLNQVISCSGANRSLVLRALLLLGDERAVGGGTEVAGARFDVEVEMTFDLALGAVELAGDRERVGSRCRCGGHVVDRRDRR